MWPETRFVASSSVAWFLICIDMLSHVSLIFDPWRENITYPDNIVGQPINFVSSSLGHLSETLGLGLVLESIAGEVDACN